MLRRFGCVFGAGFLCERGLLCEAVGGWGMCTLESSTSEEECIRESSDSAPFRDSSDDVSMNKFVEIHTLVLDLINGIYFKFPGSERESCLMKKGMTP